MAERDTTAEAARIQLEVYRKMPPGERLRIAGELTELSRELLASGVRARHPEYDAEAVRLATIRLWLGVELFKMAYPDQPEYDP